MSRIYKLKMIIGGSSGSGKTSFLLGKPTLDLDYSNLGVSFKPVECIVNNRDTYQFIMWDLKIKEKFKFLYPVFCRGTSGALLFFDINDHKSFEELSYWIKIIRKNAIIDDYKIPIILIANKTDLNNACVSEGEINNLVEKYELDGFFLNSIYDKGMKKKKNRIFKKLIEKIQPFYLVEDISIFIPKEDDEFRDFLEYFSTCTICGKKLHYDSLKNFYFSRDPFYINLKDKLLHLFEQSKDFNNLYPNKITLGIPCCSCFENFVNLK